MKNQLLIAALLLISTQALAEPTYYANINLAAHHWNRADTSRLNLNEFNPGIGIERENGNFRQMAGIYKNSIRKPSIYALAAYIPVHAGPLNIGIAGGLVTGYKKALVPAAGLAIILTEQGQRLGLNLIAVPSVKKLGICGFLGIQARIKL
ncbi:MAG TPA: hypothetical protein VN368_02715 [Candidatus Methylomirabilis sp.]|nr:hypothetical protein [Candidatus Methylomirabilis sp.]